LEEKNADFRIGLVGFGNDSPLNDSGSFTSGLADMSCAMIYWGKNYDRFFEIFTRYGAVLDLRPLYGKQIGEYDRIVEPVLLSGF